VWGRRWQSTVAHRQEIYENRDPVHLTITDLAAARQHNLLISESEFSRESAPS
jgi:hypothetical protein